MSGMFTVCPKCALTLVVTPADLRIAQGYVRCGRCSSVFNALPRLSEERGAAPAEAGPAGTEAGTATAQGSGAGADEATAQVDAETPAAAESAAPEPPADEPVADESLEFDPETTDVNSVFVQPPPDPQWTAATGSFRTLVAANQEATASELADSQVDVEIDAAFLASMLRSEADTAAAESSPPATVQPAPRAPAPASNAPPPRAAPRHGISHARPAALAAAAPPPAARARVPAPEPPVPARAGFASAPLPAQREDEDEYEDDDAASDTQETQRASIVARLGARLRAHAWPIGAVLAALLLAAQIVNHDRDELAASARLYRPLTALYGALGVKLFPRWDLRAYDVRQLGAEADPAGTGVITVRASIKNAAGQAQPLPLLRVTLQDRFGNRIAARDVAPRAYLPATIPAASFLSAGQRIDAEMGFADPGADAVGFEIDACLPARGGIACANDATLR